MSDLERRLRAQDDSSASDAVEDLVSAAMTRAADEGLVDVAWAVAETPIGSLTVAATDAGLVRVEFGHQEDTLEHLAREISPRVVRFPQRLDRVRHQLDEYFEGSRRDFDVEIDWQLSHGFRRKVLEALFAEVGFGHVVSYGELAERVGNPKASRAVGTAMATNPIPIVVPCHRVLRSGGALGGYGGGLPVKEFLLRHEGAML
jgi:methylated-DNA-[protein]-cysteine S-methyltransferase